MKRKTKKRRMRMPDNPVESKWKNFLRDSIQKQEYVHHVAKAVKR